MTAVTPLPPTAPERPPAHEPVTSARQTPEQRLARGLIIGSVLVLIGVIALFATLTNTSLLGVLILPTLGVVLVIWGSVARRASLIIPGSIILGVGAGTLLVDQVVTRASESDKGAIILLCLAVGFGLITPLTWAFSQHMHWWPLIPATIIAVTGIGLLAGEAGVEFLNWLGRLWPLALIVVGLVLLWNVVRRR